VAFIRDDRDDVLEAGNFEDFTDRGLQSEHGDPPPAAVARFAVDKMLRRPAEEIYVTSRMSKITRERPSLIAAPADDSRLGALIASILPAMR
jgi:hypothetical protein